MRYNYCKNQICILITTLVLTIALPVQAAQIPTLNATAKQRPEQAFEKVQAISVDQSQAGMVTLGQRSNITAVKKWVGKAPRQTTSLAKIRKKISSKSVMIMDAETGETIFSKSPDNPRQPASTIKILTGMIAIKSLEDNDTVGVSRHASGMPRSKIYLDTKKQYKADDLINAVLLASANDASVALAEKIAGSEPDFAKMMTLRAKLWGAKKTICRTASGLTAKGQQSTARDLATIFRHLMENDEFARRMNKTKIKTSYGKTLRNHNKALWKVAGAVGGKTGYTAAARQTYVGKFTRDEGGIIVAIMGSETMWYDIKHLVEYGFQRKQQIAEAAKKQETRIAQADKSLPKKYTKTVPTEKSLQN